jgi:hypothetical protein
MEKCRKKNIGFEVQWHACEDKEALWKRHVKNTGS